MDALVGDYADAVVIPDETLEREFAARVDEASRLAFSVAMGVVHNRADAEDVAQEALIRAYRNFKRLREPAAFRGWLVRIAWRLAIDHRRSAGRREQRELESFDPPAGPDVEQLAAAREFGERLWRAVDELPEKLRMVVVLGGIEGYDHGEVAALLRLPEGTVRSRLFAARKKLVEKLRETLPDRLTGTLT
ncbi:MAG TPA: sigma-70 family RNA polymerase sigma factor [Terriglobia bacterium]|nr:sigma-70 family RNA polymerase sigma factor [Terriglobia bacterium]